MNFTIKVSQNDKVIDNIRTHSIRLTLKHLRTIKWQSIGTKLYLRVSYGKKKDQSGKYSTFFNDGNYENKKDLWEAFDAFTERS